MRAKNHPKIQSIRPRFKILLPDSGARFSKLVPANTNRSATLIENPTNCKQNVYFPFGLTTKCTHDFSFLVSMADVFVLPILFNNINVLSNTFEIH